MIEKPAVYQKNKISGNFERVSNFVNTPLPYFFNRLLFNDPVIFTLRSSQTVVSVGEEVELTITANWSYLNPNRLFTFEGSNEYTLKLITPDGFVITSGGEYLRGSVDAVNPTNTYTVKGYFEYIGNTQPKLDFKLIRSNIRANESSVFALKNILTLGSTDYRKEIYRRVEANSPDKEAINIAEAFQNSVMNNATFLGNRSFRVLTPCPKRNVPVNFGISLANSTNSPKTLYVYTCYNDCSKITEHTITVPANSSAAEYTIAEALGLDVSKSQLHTHVHLAPIPATQSSSCTNAIGSHEVINLLTLYPSINFDITPKEKSIELGESVTINTSGCTSAPTWSNGQTGETQTFTPLSVGSHSYTATCTTSSCLTPLISTISVTQSCVSATTPTVESDKYEIAHGQVASLKATNCNGIIAWIGPNSFTTSDSNPKVTKPGNYSATCSNDCNGQNTSPVSNVITISLVPLRIESNKDEAYYGENVILTAYGCHGYLQWKDPQENITSVVNDPSNTFRGPGVYQARCISFLDEVSGWVSIEIGVKTTPAHIAYADKSHANPNETVILTAEGCEPYFYNWDINGQSKFDATQTVTGPGTYRVRCIYDDNTPYGDYVDVTVLTKPINTPNVSADKTVAYEIETVNLTASGCEPYFYNWNINGQSLFGATQTVTGAGTYSVRCILNDNSPYGAYVSITVAPKVINKPTASADRGKAYEAETVNLTATGCEPYYYQWSINGQSQFGANQTVAGPGAYSVRCYYSDQLSASEFVTVNVAPKPLNTPTAFASQPASAVGETVNLSATGCESSGYRWLINQDGNVAYVFSSSTTVANPGTYYVSCYSGNQVGSASEITIKPKPPGAINIEASKTHGCSDEPIALKGSGCPNGKIVWRKDLSTFLGNENPTLTMGNMRKNRSWNNNALTINGQAYSSGLGVLAKTEVTYNLAQQFSSFSAIVGIDDEEKGNCGSPKTVTYKVYGDGTLLLSRTVTQNDGGVQITVDITGKNLLKLVVEPEPGKDWCSHADWANAKLSPVSGADEIQSGNQVDFFGSGTYEAYCVTGGISGPKSSIDILPCDANLPRIITSKTRVFPNETFTLNASGNHY